MRDTTTTLTKTLLFWVDLLAHWVVYGVLWALIIALLVWVFR